MTAVGASRGRPRDEAGQVTLLVLGAAMVALLLVAGTVAVTSVHLSRMRLLDVADGAALAAANALDEGAYASGVGDAVPVSDATVRQAAAGYVAARPLPVGVEAWALDGGTGTPDGRTAVVAMTGTADLPLAGPALDALGGSVTISVVSRARADVLAGGAAEDRGPRPLGGRAPSV
ncbi:MAG TPA: pilus assembly protein TadG-related protein [Dermatophilaceae bacterium]|nr:pilus assembly protein TadG-related protein [Dermatophilaceae bacterium]